MTEAIVCKAQRGGGDFLAAAGTLRQLMFIVASAAWISLRKAKCCPPLTARQHFSVPLDCGKNLHLCRVNAFENPLFKWGLRSGFWIPL